MAITQVTIDRALKDFLENGGTVRKIIARQLPPRCTWCNQSFTPDKPHYKLCPDCGKKYHRLTSTKDLHQLAQSDYQAFSKAKRKVFIEGMSKGQGQSKT